MRLILQYSLLWISRFHGVCKRKSSKNFEAQIQSKGGGKEYLGKFADEEDAARAYDQAARRIHGDMVRTLLLLLLPLLLDLQLPLLPAPTADLPPPLQAVLNFPNDHTFVERDQMQRTAPAPKRRKKSAAADAKEAATAANAVSMRAFVR